MKRFISVAVCAVMAFTSTARTSRKQIHSPKAAEFIASLGTPMVAKQTAQSAVGPPRTNFVYKVGLAWLEDPDSQPLVSTFTLYVGRAPGTYDYWTNDIGTNLFYTFARTNWDDERLNRHFFVVTAKDQDGNESLPSNEVHYPPFPPDHYRLTWSSNWDQVTIFETTDLSVPRTDWAVTATVSSTNTYSDWIDPRSSCKFFCLDKPDVLTITVFNPNP